MLLEPVLNGWGGSPACAVMAAVIILRPHATSDGSHEMLMSVPKGPATQMKDAHNPSAQG